MKKYLTLLAALVFLSLASPAQAGDALNIIVPTMIDAQETNGGGSITAFSVQSSTDSMEFLFQCPKAVTITTLGFTYGARTGTPPTYQIDLEGINSSGRADGTIKSSTNAKATFTPPADATWDGLQKYQTMTSSYACTQGEFLAEVIKYSSGTINSSNKSTFGYQTGWTGGGYAFPLTVTVTSGTPTRQGGLPIFAFGDGTSVYGYPIQSITQDCYSTATEDAITFVIPSSWCSTASLRGISFFGATPNAGKDVAYNLYSGVAAGSTTVLDTATVLGNYLQSNGAGRETKVVFTSSTTLTCGNGYRISAAPTGAAASFCLNSAVVNSNNDFTAWPWGVNTYFSTRAGGNWTDTTTKRPMITFAFSSITAPAAGGLVGNPTAMNGGMQ